MDINYIILSSSNKYYKCLFYNLKKCKNMQVVDWNHSNFNKLIFYNKILKTLQKNTFVILIDASDVICINNNINEMYNEFKSFNKDIVFGAENGGHFVFEKHQNQNLLKYMNIFNLEPPTFSIKYGRRWLTNNNILNSGLICGYSDKISNFFDMVINENKNNTSDQISIINTIINNPILEKSISVDYKNSLFHNFSVFHEDYLINENNCLKYKNKLIKPYFIHFPGITFANQSKLFVDVLNKFNINI